MFVVDLTVCPSVSQCDECYQHHARCLGGALVLPGLLQGRWNLLCQCASVTVLQCYIPATVGVSSCHRVTRPQLDSGDQCAPPLLIWSISGPRNFWSESRVVAAGPTFHLVEIISGVTSPPLPSPHTSTLSIIFNTTHYQQYTNNICMFTILHIPGLWFRPPSGGKEWSARPSFIIITCPTCPYKSDHSAPHSFYPARFRCVFVFSVARQKPQISVYFEAGSSGDHWPVSQYVNCWVVIVCIIGWPLPLQLAGQRLPHSGEELVWWYALAGLPGHSK